MNVESGLIILAFFTSTLSAVTAAGGGMLLISAMALFLPVNIVIPIHAVTQLISNFSRAILSPGAVAWKIIFPFMLGIALGIPGATSTYNVFQTKFSALPLGIFVLLMVWIPPGKIAYLLTRNEKPNKQGSVTDYPSPSMISLGQLGFGLLGFIQIFITLFVGSSAPLNLPFLIQQHLKRDQLVATSAMMMTGVSLAKISIFLAAGFCFSSFIWLILGLIIAVFVGSWVGTRVRQYIPEQRFAHLLKMVLTLLSLRLIAISFM